MIQHQVEAFNQSNFEPHRGIMVRIISIPGYISVFRDIAINYLLSAKLFGNKQHLSNSWKYAKTSFQVSCAVGDMPGLFRAVLVLALICIEALLSSFILSNRQSYIKQ